MASLGDFDGEGAADLAVGIRLDDNGGSGRGGVGVMFLDSKVHPCVGVEDGTPCAEDGLECTDDVCIADECEHPSLPAVRPDDISYAEVNRADPRRGG